MHPVLIAFGRALLSQLHYRMLVLTIMPFLLSVAICGVALWQGLQPLIDWLQGYFLENNGFRISGNILALLGLGALKAVLVPLIAMWLLLPLMIVTALLCIGGIAMPIIARHVGQRHFPELEARSGGSFWGSLWMSGSSFVVFVLLWLLALPLSLVPPLTLIILTVLWGWLTYRVMAYDALADYADAEELRVILRIHRWPLLVIGAVSGAMGGAPTMLWLGGVLSGIFFPLLAAGSIWLYVLVFVFTGLWFQYYCLAALEKYRATDVAGGPSPQAMLKDIN